MKKERFPRTASHGAWIALGGIAVAGLEWLSLRNGIYSTPDSWAYWEGSVSLLESGRYTLLDGPPIRPWPPLFSAYLAAVQFFLGVSGRSVLLAQCLLVAAQFAGWLALVSWVARRSFPSHRFGVGFWTGMALFTASYFLSTQHFLTASSLQLAMLPWVAFRLLKESVGGTPTIKGLSALSAGLALLLLTHNASIAILASALVVLVWSQRRLTATHGVLLAAVIPWILTRLALQQTGSHRVGLGEGRLPAKDTLLQMVAGLGEPLVPASRSWLGMALGTCWLLALWWTLREAARDTRGRAMPRCDPGRQLGLFGAGTLIALFVLFNLVWVQDGLNGRFLWFPALSTAFWFLMLGYSRRKSLFVPVLVLLTAVPSLRALKYCRQSVVAPVTEGPERTFGVVIEPELTIGTETDSTHSEGLRQVVPPRYPWQRPEDSTRSR